MDEALSLADEVVRATAEIARLTRQRTQLAKDSERAGRRTDPDAQSAIADANARMAQLERDIQAQRSKESSARKQLATKNKVIDEELEQLESKAYRLRRPPAGQGVRLTEADFRNAQNSVPQIAFFAALLGVTALAAIAISNLSLPGILSIVLALVSFVGPMVLGIWSLVYAARADRRAARDDAHAKETAPSPPSQSLTE